jgi:tetratricopeptide (TPR) repeat protein
MNHRSKKNLLVEEGLPVFMGNYPTSLNDFMNAYRLGNFSEAKKEGIYQLQFRQSDTVFFYLGCCYIYEGNYSEALSFLNKIHTTSIFENSINYQKAFALARSGRVNEAKPILLKLINHSDSIHKLAAKKLFDTLN